MINQLIFIFLPKKCQKIEKHSLFFQSPKWRLFLAYFFPTSSLKPIDSSFAIINVKEKWDI